MKCKEVMKLVEDIENANNAMEVICFLQSMRGRIGEVEDLEEEIERKEALRLEDNKLLLLVSKLVPDYSKYEDQAVRLMDKYGYLKALKSLDRKGV